MSELFDNWIYEKTSDNSARFVLGEKGNNPLICIGVNPSTATPEKLDNTLRRVRKFSQVNGFDGWIMFNLYPQRATDPNGLHAEMDYSLFYENAYRIQKVFQRIEGRTLWAAWGCLIEKRSYLKNCLRFIATAAQIYNARWVTFNKTTKDGHPRHPLYLPGDAAMYDFDICKYLKTINETK